jgi:hypothetical protein
MGPVWFEGPLVEFLRGHVAVVIPLFILFLKIVVLRISGDVKELIHSIVITPMEVALIAMGFVFAGLARTIPFQAPFHSDTAKDLAGTILIFVISIVLAIMYRANRKAIVYFERFVIAVDNSYLQEQQPKLVFIRHAGQSAEWSTAWAAAYFLLAILIWSANLGVAIMVLWQTLLRIG